MHIPDGFVPLSFAVAGYAGAAAVTALSLNRIARRPDPQADLPKAAMLTAAFFVASLVHIPIPPTSVHLLLPGLMGAMLGWFAFPAILVGLFFQAVMFGHGGLTTLGLNGLVLGLPALAAAALFRLRGPGSPRRDAVLGFAAGAGGVLLALAGFVPLLVLGMPTHLDAAVERAAIGALALAHAPLVLIEGVVVATTVSTLRRVSPGLLRGL
jgi:cobalt/nickel transport system permease protein